MARKKTKDTAIEQSRGSLIVGFEITGTAPLLQNKFAQKSIDAMLRKQMGISALRVPKVPEKCVEDATVRNESGRVCIPPAAIKMAMLSASTQVKGLKKTQLRIQIFVIGNSVPITYERTDISMVPVPVGGMNRTMDIRFRPEFFGWKARLLIAMGDQIAVETVTDLLSRAGMVGVGEWRPERNGTHGTFRVSRTLDVKEMAEVRAECSVPLVQLKIPDWARGIEFTAEVLARLGDVAAGKEDVAAGKEEDSADESDE